MILTRRLCNTPLLGGYFNHIQFFDIIPFPTSDKVSIFVDWNVRVILYYQIIYVRYHYLHIVSGGSLFPLLIISGIISQAYLILINVFSCSQKPKFYISRFVASSFLFHYFLYPLIPIVKLVVFIMTNIPNFLYLVSLGVFSVSFYSYLLHLKFIYWYDDILASLDLSV